MFLNESVSVPIVVFAILATFLVLFVLLITIILSRATVVRFLLTRIGRILRMGRRVSLRGPRGISEVQGVVGTSGYAAIKRIWQPKTFTERAMDRSDIRAPIVAQALDEMVRDYLPSQETADFDDYITRYRDDVARRWNEERERLLEKERRTAFERHYTALLKRFRADPALVVKPEYLDEEGRFIGATGGDPGEDRPADGELTFGMLDFSKVAIPHLTPFDEEMIINQGAFAAEEDALEREGSVFQEISAKAHYLPDRDEPDATGAAKNYLLASDLFQYDISVNDDPDLLYEDLNDAAIADMIGNSDRKTLYFLTQWRMTANHNVFFLSIILSSILTTVLIANYLYGYAVVYKDFQTGEYYDLAKTFWITNIFPQLGTWLETSGIPVMSEDADLVIIGISKSLFALVTVIAGYLGAVFVFRFPYSHFQRVNRTEVVAFMRSKTARLNRDFYQALSQARGAFSGDRMSLSSRELAKIWFVNMQWIGFRMFHIEVFLRSILYQVKRNSGYYVLGVPMLFLLPVSLAIAVIFILNPGTLAPGLMTGDYVRALEEIGIWLAQNGVFLIAFYWLAVSVVFRSHLAKCVADLLNIDDAAWQNFHNFDIQRQSGSLIRHYVGEIYNERVRVRAGGSGN